ncbi:FAD/NAD(P)-binding oxidoreductase [Pigmentiphaga sp.]|uniref:NAD(P)/FAD-dependent oxidoreductase n=1 Tax=Pigmentiphaga sp. TaxID=1977564 RepID=UPI0025EF06FD|nr:FAD/NAD(P)-binding oxidoreductase [Pigmentiphaga sp.]
MIDRIVIVGGGQAGYQLAQFLRDQQYSGAILLLGEEPELPYQRPPLSKIYLEGKSGPQQLAFQPASYFQRRGIEVQTGVRIAAIDRHRRRIQTACGHSFEYGHLVLAVGARNRELPGSTRLRSVHSLRTRQEADELRDRLPAIRRAAVIGAGFVGLEFASVAAAQGIAVDVVDTATRLMQRSASPQVAEAFRRRHESRGVRFHLASGTPRILSEHGHATGIETSAGDRLPADLVLVAIGVVPNIELAAAAGLAVGNGILVDERLRTNDKHISALGDCACFPSRFAPDGRCRLESVPNAMSQARQLAAILTGQAPRYEDELPWFWSNQAGLKLQIAGMSQNIDAWIARSAAIDAFSVYGFRDRRLVAVESVNRPGDHVVAKRLLGTGIHVTPEQMADPRFDLPMTAH